MKAKADKMFDKQFAADAAKAAQSEDAPRAALYEGKMGQNHRKATRMQQKSSPIDSVRNGVSSAQGMLSGITVTSRNLKIATAVACVFIALLFLYAPAQQYYQAHRELDRLTIEYSSIEERNAALDVQNDALVSDAGMEDAVRQKFGYVREGEEVAIVTGLSDETTNTARDSENIEANVLSSSVKAPEEWYTPFLDALFGVR